jgi:hypothetical protein
MEVHVYWTEKVTTTKQKEYQGCLNRAWQVVLATSPGNPPVVQRLAGGLVWFGSRPGQQLDLFCLRGFVTRTGHKLAVFWPGWNRPAVPTLRFPHQCLQFSVWVLIVSWHDQYEDCAVRATLSPPAFTFAIPPIFIAWLWKMDKCYATLAGFWLRLNEHWSDPKSEISWWKSGKDSTIYVLIILWYDQNWNT